MKITINNTLLNEAVTKIKRCGYAEFVDPRTKETSFVKRIRGYFYPRFHIYIQQEKSGTLFYDLHLDQKKPSYEGSHMHNAEYDSEVVQQEGRRIKDMLAEL